VPGKYASLEKNPEYWGTTSGHRRTKSPISDKLKIVIIPDEMDAVESDAHRQNRLHEPDSYKGARKLKKTNPKIGANQDARSAGAFDTSPQTTKPPYNDIRVRLRRCSWPSTPDHRPIPILRVSVTEPRT